MSIMLALQATFARTSNAPPTLSLSAGGQSVHAVRGSRPQIPQFTLKVGAESGFCRHWCFVKIGGTVGSLTSNLIGGQAPSKDAPWQDKVPAATFSRRFAAFLFPDWDNLSKGD
jgi:hypothetical protein